MIVSVPAAAQDATGDWVGMLDVGNGTKVRVVVHIAPGPQGVLAGTLDSPDQGIAGVALAEIVAGDGRLAFVVPTFMGRYQAVWDAGAKLWRGTWQQDQGPTPLEFAPAPPPPPLPANWQVPADAEIARLIADRNAQRTGQGTVVGVLGPEGERIVAGGPADGPAFDGSSLFEIGSISKVFTALLLADMANKGEVSLDDPAAKYLPVGHRMPERGARQITLRDLSLHTSGLPRLPDNMPMGTPEDPYVDYREEQLLAFLDRYELPRDIGTQSEYSNLGAGLLGYLLGRAANSDYETLLAERITGPLGMRDTVVTLPNTARLVPAFDMYMRPAKPWNFPTLAGAGGIRSTTVDMLRFAAAVVDGKSPIADAVATVLAQRVGIGNPRAEQVLGWQIMVPEPGREVLFHNGGTGGFRSALVIEPARKTAVVVLMNSAVEPSATDFAVHLLVGTRLAPTSRVPPAPPTAARTEVALPIAELERVVGRYVFGAGIVFDVTREGSVLRAQRQGAAVGPVMPIFAEAPLRFFWKGVDAQVRFTTDEDGAITGAVFSQGGQELTGRRVGP
jgi:CubicO group peptidase (beta-lactamase class C family)